MLRRCVEKVIDEILNLRLRILNVFLWVFSEIKSSIALEECSVEGHDECLVILPQTVSKFGVRNGERSLDSMNFFDFPIEAL